MLVRKKKGAADEAIGFLTTCQLYIELLTLPQVRYLTVPFGTLSV